MSYTEALERLKQLQDGPAGAVPKAPKASFVTYGTPAPGASENPKPTVTYGGYGLERNSESTLSQSKSSETLTPGGARSAKNPQVVSLVRCGDCQHFKPDPTNPLSGMGRCRVNTDGDRPPWPNAPRRCNSFKITRAGVFRVAQTACKGTSVDPSELTDWLIRQNDPDWLRPAAIRRWAECIEKRNGYPDGNPSKHHALEPGLDGAKPEKEQKKHVFPY